MDTDLFPPTAPDFSDPLGLLRACHERIQRHCQTLERLVGHLREHGVDNEARKAVQSTYQYFSRAARHHHQDEEEDLFPRLARVSLKLADIVHRLRQEHEAMNASWERLEPMLRNTRQMSEEIDAFAAEVETFTGLYRAHIARENEELLDIAQHVLSSDELKKIGKAMAERRGQQYL